MTCANGHPVGPDAHYCPTCGAPVASNAANVRQSGGATDPATHLVNEAPVSPQPLGGSQITGQTPTVPVTATSREPLASPGDLATAPIVGASEVCEPPDDERSTDEEYPASAATAAAVTAQGAESSSTYRVPVTSDDERAGNTGRPGDTDGSDGLRSGKKRRRILAAVAAVIVIAGAGGAALAASGHNRPNPGRSKKTADKSPARLSTSTTASTSSTAPTSTVVPLPNLTWQFQSTSVSTGTAPVITYSVGPLPKGDTLVAQRTVGTSNGFQTVASLTPGRGTASLPAPPQGEFTYRVAILNGSGSVLSSSNRTLYSYAAVPLAVFLTNMPSTTFGVGFGRATGQIGLNSQEFSYVAREDNGPTVTVITITSSATCNHISLQFAEANTSFTGPAAIESLTLLQANADPVPFQLQPGVVVPLTASLSPGSWGIKYVSDQGGVGKVFYVNGSLSCYTATGFPSSS